MKIQQLFSTTLILLFLSLTGITAFSQSSQQKMRDALNEMPTKATLQKLEPKMQAIMEETIAILEEGSKIKDASSAEAKALFERSERNASALTGVAYQACKKKCDDTYVSCLDDCGTDFLCRAVCRSRHNWCLIACHYSKGDKVPAVEEPAEDEVGGGKK